MSSVETTNLKFCLLNAENFFLMFDSPLEAVPANIKEVDWQLLSSSLYPNKPLKKCQEIATTFKEINADIIMLCEVGGFESLKNFNHLFMNNEYHPCLLEGNSDRNIDVGFLIKKNCTFYFDLQTNRHRSINYLYPHERLSIETGYVSGETKKSHKFSRDVAELKLFAKDREKPFLVILLTHLKSRLDPERIDPNGFERRRAELMTLLDIYQELQRQHPSVPVIVAGDFNGNATRLNTDREFEALYKNTKLEDVLEVFSVAQEDRTTFYNIRNGSKPDGKQIDFAFVDESLKSKLNNAYVYRYLNERGLSALPPRTLDAKFKLPSDHYPIVFELKGLLLK